MIYGTIKHVRIHNTKHIRLNMHNTNYNNHLTNTIFVGMHNFETGQGISFGSACEF